MKWNNKYFSITIILFFCAVSLTAQKKPFTLEDIYVKNTFSSEFFSGYNVLNNGEEYLEIESSLDSTVWLQRKIRDGKLCNLFFNTKWVIDKLPVSNYELSADEKFILVSSMPERIYRHSMKSINYVIDISKKKITQIDNEKIMYATLSPDNKAVAYVKNNNLYLFELATGKIVQITADGEKNKIINGAVDWVYEEEFSMSKGFEWNADGTKIAYYKFDESKVKEFSMTLFRGLYPTEEKWKYPKAGEENSKVDVFVYNLNSGQTTTLNLGSENDQYIPRIKWTLDANTLSIQRLNRLQNKWELIFADASNGNLQTILTENSQTYIDINDNLQFVFSKSQFYFTSEKSGYNHIYFYDMIAQKETQITHGNWDVIELLSIDEKRKLIYYTSSQFSPIEKHFYKWDMKKNSFTDVLPEIGNHQITFFPGNKYFIEEFSTQSTPPVWTLYSVDKNFSRVIQNNEKLQNSIKEYAFGNCEQGVLNTAEGVSLNYWMIKPHNFDPSKKYPVFMHVYGGPGHNTVNNKYEYSNYLWHQYLTTQGYIVVSVDNRGTGGRGKEFKHATYKNLGNLEWKDQTSAANYFAGLSFVDKNRIGIWGWSFGGYLSSLCLSKSPDVFKMAIAVAPVTNWRFYDNIYTERFLQKPQDNPKGYDENSPIHFVKNIKGKYLIVHGTADDNVHFQNAVEMVNAMISAGIEFDSELYPNRDHSIRGPGVRYHLFKRLNKFVLENL